MKSRKYRYMYEKQVSEEGCIDRSLQLEKYRDGYSKERSMKVWGVKDRFRFFILVLKCKFYFCKLLFLS